MEGFNCQWARALFVSSADVSHEARSRQKRLVRGETRPATSSDLGLHQPACRHARAMHNLKAIVTCTSISPGSRRKGEQGMACRSTIVGSCDQTSEDV